MPFKKIYIPKSKKKIQKQFFDVQKIIKFEREIFDLYNKGKNNSVRKKATREKLNILFI